MACTFSYLTVIRIAIMVLSLIAIWSVGDIAFAHWSDTAYCPMIGVIPACYVILIAYSLLFLSMWLPLKASLKLFLFSWLVIMSLAIIGIIGELTTTLACPRSENGIPKCYFSALFSLVIGVLYWRFYQGNKE